MHVLSTACYRPNYVLADHTKSVLFLLLYLAFFSAEALLKGMRPSLLCQRSYFNVGERFTKRPRARHSLSKACRPPGNHERLVLSRQVGNYNDFFLQSSLRLPFTRLLTTTSNNDLLSPAQRFSDATVAEVLQGSLNTLQAGNVPEPTSSVVNLLAAALHLDWETGYRDLQSILAAPSAPSALAHRRLTPAEASCYQDYLQRRLQLEPIQYIVGAWDFLDYRLVIRPALLCPRPETEELVELVLSHCSTSQRILDVGCGTGCIGIALAHRLPLATVTAIDIEPVAVEAATENAKAVLGSTDRYQARLVSAQDFCVDVPFDLVVSNPPYIPFPDMAALESTVVEYESHEALCGGEDGLDVIRVILDQLPCWSRPGADCWMEVDPTHPKRLAAMLADHEFVEFVSSHKDLYGRERFVRVRVKEEAS